MIALLLCLSVLAVGCSKDSSSSGSGEKLPDAKKLLDESAAVMAKVTSLGFTLKTEGEVQGLGIRSAEGTINAEGNVQATALVGVGGRAVEYEFFLVDGKNYLKGPTGGFQDVPPELASSLFDPEALLRGEKSLSKGLAKSTKPVTEAEEDVDGVDSYRIKATVNPSSVEGLSVLTSGSSQQANLWISKDTKHLVKATMTAETDEGDKTTLTVTFSDFNKNVEIKAPV